MAAESLIEVIGPYMLNVEFSDHARSLGLEIVSEKLNESIYKNATLCIRYAINAIAHKNNVLCKRYLHLALALNPELENDNLYSLVLNSLNEHDPMGFLSHRLGGVENLKTRLISYDPPIGYVQISN